MMLLTYTIVEFYFVHITLYRNGTVDMQICAPLTRSQCKVPDTQVTARPVDLLLRILLEIDI